MSISEVSVKSHTRSRILLGFAVCWLALAGAAAKAQTKDRTRIEIQHLIYSVKGQDLFRAHCAACHGLEGKGGGPVASALKAKVPDLTLLAKSHSGKFPSAQVRNWIAGDEVSQSHGSREMPIWGPVFHQIESDQDFGNVRLQNLTKYLESIQQ